MIRWNKSVLILSLFFWENYFKERMFVRNVFLNMIIEFVCLFDGHNAISIDKSSEKLEFWWLKIGLIGIEDALKFESLEACM